MKARRLTLTITLILLCSQTNGAAPNLIREFNSEYSAYVEFAEKGMWEKALPHMEKSYQLGKDVLEHEDIAKLTYNYGLNLTELRRREEASEMLRLAVGAYEDLYGKKSAKLIPLLMDLATHLPFTTKKGQRRKILQRALKISETESGEYSAEHGQRLVTAGVLMLLLEYSTSARQYLNKGYEILKATLGEDAPQTAHAAFNLGKYALSYGRSRQSIRYFQNALIAFDDPDRPSSQLELSTHGFLVVAYEKIGAREKATKHCLAIGRMTPITETQQYQPLVKKAPLYPSNAARQGSTGYVIVEYEVDEMGFVRNPKAVDNEGHPSMIKASIQAAKEFRYAPAFVDGKPVVTSGVRNKFTFSLD